MLQQQQPPKSFQAAFQAHHSLPANLPAKLPANLPANLSGNLPGNLPANLPANVPHTGQLKPGPQVLLNQNGKILELQMPVNRTPIGQEKRERDENWKKYLIRWVMNEQ